jgi:hypothetical protein
MLMAAAGGAVLAGELPADLEIKAAVRGALTGAVAPWKACENIIVLKGGNGNQYRFAYEG